MKSAHPVKTLRSFRSCRTSRTGRSRCLEWPLCARSGRRPHQRGANRVYHWRVGGTAMELRVFVHTGMQLSVLGFGCRAVGGLMVRGYPTDQERTVARAIAAGVNYFDTAVLYGNGESENNLGRVLQKLKPAGVIVGTKVRVPPGEAGRVAGAVTMSLEGSLPLLRLYRVHTLY